MVCMKWLKWILKNIFWLKKYEKVYLMSEKEKQWKGDFLVKSSNILITIKNFCIISFYFYHSKLGFYICFFNCQSFKCGQLWHNHIKRDLSDPNFSCTTLVIPIFMCRITVVHLKNLRVHIFIHIQIHSFENVVIGDF